MYELCDGREQDKCEKPFREGGKGLRVACVFHDCKVGGRQGTQHGGKPKSGCTHAQQN